jgi:hypothetical protein
MTGSRSVSLLTLFALGVAWALSSAEKPADSPAVYTIHIDSQPLGDALQEFAAQSGVQIIFFSRLVEGRTAPAIHGNYTLTAALDLLLAKSGLTYRVINPTTIEIRISETAVHPQHEISWFAVPAMK